jgi:pSer/pThr/pTyr-binding forkhead associated (FHA) protein
MPRLLITNGVQQGRVYRLRPGVNRIGRSVDNHFQVPDPSVSSSHCEVTLSETAVLVRDLNSTNGTFVDGAPVAESGIGPGQVLQLGSIEMRLDEVSPTEEAASVNIPEIAPAPRPISPVLPDGSAGCVNHPEVHALYKCGKCEQTLCGSCVRVVRRLGGETMVFCTLCAAPCETLTPPPEAAPAAAAAKPGLLARIITQRLKLPFKR